MMLGILALLAVCIVLILGVLVGRSSEPFELEKEVAPGVKPFVPSEEMGILGTRRLQMQEILKQEGEAVPLEVWINSPEVEIAIEEGMNLLAEGQPELAVEIFLKALATDPDNPDLLLALGDAYQALQRYQEGLEAYLKAEEALPEDVSVLLRLGEVWQQLQEPDRALEVYRRVLIINPEDAQAADAIDLLEQ
ncbi:MAG TPA: tetratricopeptide repeat protein [Candidatus Deferrimicrobium sp.]|nr:tetratricopeptide repeat protein [Candidatus Deferrimicrobium sp.]